MRKQIRYVPDSIVLDLSEPDLGHPDGLDILQQHYRQSERPSLGFSKEHPAFVCLTHEGGTNPGLFLKKINGDWHAVHYESGTCSSHRLPAPMSDEHKRQTEYWARAAQDAGWAVDQEHALHTGTRPDALIHGPVMTGIEVQRSSMTPGHAVKRTAKALDAGVTDVWYSDRTLPPKWAWRVPSVISRENAAEKGWNGIDWRSVPPRRAVRAAGLRKIEAARCTMTSFQRCPYSRRNWCGNWHPKPRPWPSLTVDDVAMQFPAGKMVMLSFYGVRMLGRRDRNAVFIVPPADRDLYTELTGWSGDPSFRADREDQPPRHPVGAIECRNEQPAPSRTGIWGTDPQELMWCDTCEHRHPVIEHRDCRAAGGQ